MTFFNLVGQWKYFFFFFKELSYNKLDPKIFLKIICFSTFGCAGSLLMHKLFSGSSEWKLLSSCGVQASHWGSFCCGVLGHPGSVAAGSVVLLHWFSCSAAYGISSDLITGIEPVFCALACGLFTFESSGKHPFF